jgi:hypothetical protein
MKTIRHARWARATLLAALLPLAACDDPFANQPWDATPATLTLYSVSRDEYVGMPSALDLVTLRAVAVEETGGAESWDFLLAEQDGAVMFVPSIVVPGTTTRSAIGEADESTLAAVTRAPGDSASYTRSPLPISEGAIYVLRSRRTVCGYVRGSHYGKMEVVALDAARGIVEVAVVRNPYCDDRDLVPPED